MTQHAPGCLGVLNARTPIAEGNATTKNNTGVIKVHRNNPLSCTL